jgi:hypothetical protein
MSEGVKEWKALHVSTFPHSSGGKPVSEAHAFVMTEWILLVFRLTAGIGRTVDLGWWNSVSQGSDASR